MKKYLILLLIMNKTIFGIKSKDETEKFNVILSNDDTAKSQSPDTRIFLNKKDKLELNNRHNSISHDIPHLNQQSSSNFEKALPKGRPLTPSEVEG